MSHSSELDLRVRVKGVPLTIGVNECVCAFERAHWVDFNSGIARIFQHAWNIFGRNSCLIRRIRLYVLGLYSVEDSVVFGSTGKVFVSNDTIAVPLKLA